MQFFINKEQDGSLKISNSGTATYQVTISRIKREGITINRLNSNGSKYINISRTGKEYRAVVEYLKEIYPYINIVKDFESFSTFYSVISK